MRVHVNDQQRVFTQHWLPIQQALGDDLTEFVRHYLMKEGKILTVADVYFKLKDRLVNADPAVAEAFLADLHRHGIFYSRFVSPQREPDANIAAGLSRLQRLESTVAYPLLLRVFDALHRDGLTHEQVTQSLDVLESFLIRRSICNLPSNQLRRMLPPVFDAVGGAGEGFVDRIREQLGGNRCPDDSTFAAALPTQPLYATAKKNARLRVVLERLEESFAHKEPAILRDAQIEHVMPQTLTPEWEHELGALAREHWARLLHTLGNLTLTGYNADMSNRPYVDKKAAFATSHFELNRYFASVEKWTADAIEARGRALAERALTLWRDLARESTPQPAGRILEPTPVAVRFRNEEHPVVTWKQATLKLVEQFEATTPGLLKEPARRQTLTNIISADATRFVRSKGQIGGVYVQTHGSAKALRSLVKSIANEAGIEEREYEFVLPSALGQLAPASS